MKVNNKKETPSSWEGVYKSWNEAKFIRKTFEGKTFEGKRWEDRIIGQLKNYKKDIKKYGSNALPPRPYSLPILLSLINFSSILDYGGSSGWVWYYLKNSIPNLKLDKFVIIKNAKVCKTLSDLNIHDNDSIVYKTINNYNDNCEVIYTNSTLQYIENDETFLSILSGNNLEYLMIEDFIGGDFDTYFSNQIYYEDRIPVKFRNKNSFIKRIEDLSFELLFSDNYITEHQGKIQKFPMSAIPISKQVKYGKTLLFKKIK